MKQCFNECIFLSSDRCVKCGHRKDESRIIPPDEMAIRERIREIERLIPELRGELVSLQHKLPTMAYKYYRE